MMKKIITTIKGWFKKKPSLRDKCIEEYGPEFGKVYDNLGSGIPVGGFIETVMILDMIEEVKEKWNL